MAVGSDPAAVVVVLAAVCRATREADVGLKRAATAAAGVNLTMTSDSRR